MRRIREVHPHEISDANLKEWDPDMCRALWCAVVRRAFEDIVFKGAIGDLARAWLMSSEAEFAIAASGLDREAVRDKVRANIWYRRSTN